jgi:DNA-binding MarR family transcriptional regulator
MLALVADRQLSKRALAEHAWRMMFEILTRTAPDRTASLGRRGLTPNDSRALFSLDPDKGRTMRSLADAWKCDPSNATWIVDRLEELGFAERRTAPDDRRVKLVLLTARGHKVRGELMKEFHQPPAVIAALEREDLERLHAILSKLVR